MGLGGINITQLLIILLIVVLIFGTKRLKSIGSDLGGALKGFRKAMDSSDDDKQPAATDKETRQIESDGEPDAEFSDQTEKKEQRQ